MYKETKELYEFGSFRLDVSEHTLTLSDGSKNYTLPEKAFQTLCVLVQKRGHLLTKQELLAEIWPDSFVEENNLDKCIHAIRQVLGEKPGEQKYIETVRKHGYRFVSEVRKVEPAPQRSFQEAGDSILSATYLDRATEIRTGVLDPDFEPQDSRMKAENGSGEKAVAFDEAKQKTLDTQTTFSKTLNRRKGVSIAAAAMLLITSVSASYYFFNRAETPFVFQAGETRRLTTNGSVASVAFSPDGKFIIYAQKERGDQQSLWMQRIGNDNAVQVAPPADIEYQGLQITPDGNTLYYIDGNRTLYQTGVLGGRVRKIADKVGRLRHQSKVAISPDGKEIATARRNDADEFVMAIMNADGTNERILFNFEGMFGMTSFSWSPDGKVIACRYAASGSHSVGTYGVLGIQAADGKYAPILEPTWQGIDDVVWLPDSRGLALAGTSNDGMDEAGPQIWQVPYTEGERRRISKDSNSYVSLGIAADGLSLIALRTDENALLETTNDAGESEPKRLTAGSEKQDGVLFLDWMPDGGLVFDSWASEKISTLAMEPGGASTKQLASSIIGRAISNDGNSLIFSKLNIGGMWSMDLRTGSERLLLSDESAWVDFTPDDKWIVFTGFGAQFGLLKVPADGGEPTRLLDGWASCPAVSPDGEMVAFTGPAAGQGIGLVSIDGGNIISKFEAQPEKPEFWGKNALQWTPDGRAINYVALNNGVSNIWRQPIDGGPPFQITKFETGRIFNFAYSRDGKQLALSRGTLNSDVVLIKNSN